MSIRESQILLFARTACAALVCAVASGSTSTQDVERAAWAEHRACVLTERTQRFLRHYEAADEAHRGRVLAQLIASRPAQAGAGWMPTLEVLRRVESLIADQAGASHDGPIVHELDAMAGALDLVVVPGAFESASEGLGDAITVQVKSLYKTQISGDFYLELYWRSREGLDVKARREPIGAAAVNVIGFPMYVRAPLAEPARWEMYGLVARPETDVFAAVLPEIRVDCVEGLRARSTAALARRLEHQPGHERLQVALARLLRAGQRTAASLGAGDMLAVIEAWSDEGPPLGSPVPIERVFVDGQSVEHWLWSYAPSVEPVRAVALIGSNFEADDHALSGVLGERWIQFAERTRSHVFTLHLPADLREVPELVRRLKAWNDGVPLIVVARGDVVARLEIGVRTDPTLTLDAVIVSHAATGASAAKIFETTPRLVIAPGADSSSGDAKFTGIDGSTLSLINDLTLATHLERWLATANLPKHDGESK